MNQITSTTDTRLSLQKEIDYCPYLKEKQRSIVKAVRQSPKCVKRRFDDEVKRRFNNIFNLAFQKARTISGFKMHEEFTPQEQILVISEMTKVVEKYSWMTLEELEFILANGLSGEFDKENDKSYALNARFLTYWIKAYQEHYREPAMKLQLQFEQRIEQEIEREQSEKKTIQSRMKNVDRLLDLYASIKGKSLSVDEIPGPDWLIGFYHTFDRKKIVIFDQEVKDEVWRKEFAKAKKTYKGEEARAKAIKSSKLILIKSKILTMAKNNVNLEELLKKADLWNL